MSKDLVRLQKYIADCGVTSRRKAENLIEEGKVKVNGRIVLELGTKVNPTKDAVCVNGNYLDYATIEQIYLVMNKPRSCVTTLSDPEGRRTVLDFCQEISERIYPVGRLDYLSEGLLILTNDGDFAQEILHPSKGIKKIYEVKVFGTVTSALLKKLRTGAVVDGIKLLPDSVRIIGTLPSKTWLEFTLTEGRNREIRKICEAYGLTIDKLKRVAIGGLTLQGLKPGESRLFSKDQIKRILNQELSGIYSSKRSVKAPKELREDSKSADSEDFHHLRKANYFETMKLKKEIEKQKKAEVSNAKNTSVKKRSSFKRGKKASV